MSDPMSYWEQRSNINEQILMKLMQICIQALPRYASEEISDLGKAWDRAIEDLDREHDV